MPVKRKMMNALREQYGSKKGEEVYYAMENKRKHKKKHNNALKGGY